MPKPDWAGSDKAKERRNKDVARGAGLQKALGNMREHVARAEALLASGNVDPEDFDDLQQSIIDHNTNAAKFLTKIEAKAAAKVKEQADAAAEDEDNL